MFKLSDKFFTVTFSDDLETAVVLFNIFGIKIKHRVKNHPLFNKYLCNKAGFKTLLISRFGGVGDFLLFRPFLKSLRNSKKFCDYKIILVTHPDYIVLSKRFDEGVVDYYIPIPVSFFKPKYKKMYSIFKGTSFNVFIDPSDGLNTGTRDVIVKSISADDKYCNVGFFTYSLARIKSIDFDIYFKKYFNHIYYNPDRPIFVRDLNKAFFEFVIGEEITDTNSINDSPHFSIDFKSKYAVISPFARGTDRVYNAEKFSYIINFIIDTYDILVVILGADNERDNANSLIKLCKQSDKILNLAGKLTYFESMFYIKNAQFLVANETGTVHIAQALGTKTICISNGSYMGTFQPYPKEISCVKYVYPDNINEIFESHPEYIGTYFDANFDKLAPEKVTEAIKSFI